MCVSPEGFGPWIRSRWTSHQTLSTTRLQYDPPVFAGTAQEGTEKGGGDMEVHHSQHAGQSLRLRPHTMTKTTGVLKQVKHIRTSTAVKHTYNCLPQGQWYKMSSDNGAHPKHLWGLTDLPGSGVPHFEGAVVRSTDNSVAMELQTRHLWWE